MNKIKSFIIADVIVLIIKVLGGLLTNSSAMMASGIYDIALIIVTLVTAKTKQENKNYKGIISSIIGIIIILLGIFVIFFSFIGFEDRERTSLFVILFLLLAIIIRYVVSCFNTNLSYQKKEGLLTVGRVKSNIDFFTYAVIIVCLILSKLSKYWAILKIADSIGTLLIASLAIIKGIKIIVASINYLEEKENRVSDEYKEEIIKRDEIKKLSSLDIRAYGGIKAAHCNIILKDSISMIDTNTFVLTLQDYLLKIADVANINLVKANKLGKVLSSIRKGTKDTKATKKVVSKNGNVKKETIKKENNKKSSGGSSTTKKNMKDSTVSIAKKNKNDSGADNTQKKKTTSSAQKKSTTPTKGRSLKEDARNSRSRNSKTNTKKKNTKKKNKKR